MDMKQACLDVSKASMELFDLVEADGIDAPMDNLDNILVLKALIDSTDSIIQYYKLRNIQRMLALGASPENLFKLGRKYL